MIGPVEHFEGHQADDDAVKLDLLEKELEAYEAQLRAEMGVEKKEISHFKRPAELEFTADQRDSTTILFGGLTLAHEQLVKAAMEGLGYRVDYLECPDNEALQFGKEFGNRGQCNPTYYTVGNLVKHLKKMHEEGMSAKEHRGESTSSSPPVRVDRVASECTKPSTARRFGIRASIASASCSFSRAEGYRRRVVRPAWT